MKSLILIELTFVAIVLTGVIVAGYSYMKKVDTMVEQNQTCTDSQGSYIAPECK